MLICDDCKQVFISIHALRGEDDRGVLLPRYTLDFISIHALRGEDDKKGTRQFPQNSHFNPRPPWGGRQRLWRLLLPLPSFQSTPSVGRTTKILTASALRCVISIHALRGEDDVYAVRVKFCVKFISIHALRGEDDI